MALYAVFSFVPLHDLTRSLRLPPLLYGKSFDPPQCEETATIPGGICSECPLSLQSRPQAAHALQKNSTHNLYTSKRLAVFSPGLSLSDGQRAEKRKLVLALVT